MGERPLYRELGSKVYELRDRAVDLEYQHRKRLQDSPGYPAPPPPVVERSEIERALADIPDIFKPLTDLPEPEPFAEAADPLKEALGPLAGPLGHDDFTDRSPKSYPPSEAFTEWDIASRFEHWTGNAAQTFKDNFVPPIPRVAWNEFSVVAALRGGLLAHESMWKTAREDVCDLVGATHRALDQFESGVDEMMALALAGAVVSIASVPFTGGTSTSLAWTAATSAIGLAGSAAGTPPVVHDPLLKGRTPLDVMDSLRNAVSDLKLQIYYVEEFIAERLTEVADSVEGVTKTQAPGGDPDDTGERVDPGAKADYTLPRPALADSTPEDVNDDDHFGDAEDD